MKPTALDPQEVDARIAAFDSWKREGEALTKTFKFGSFREAMSFMVRVAFEAEALDHHPEWTNIYDRVILRLSTHAAGNRITEKDLQLAQAIERINWT